MAKQWSIIEDGLIRPPDALEVIVSDHCNLTCRQCNHASPIVPKWNVDPDDAFREMSALARYYRPRRVKLLGGEPLLNPRIAEIAEATKKSGITPHVVLITNGVLLPRLTSEGWHHLDEVEITRYPDAGLSDEVVEWAIERARETQTKLTRTSVTEFRYTMSRVANEDAASVERIFGACKIASIWGCHALYKGRLYRCPQSIYARTFAPIRGAEGIALEDGPGFRERLLAFLNADAPLESCRYCVGTSGRKVPHEMLSRSRWAADLDLSPAAMLDDELLAEALVAPSIIDDCRVVVGEHAVVERPQTRARRLGRFWQR